MTSAPYLRLRLQTDALGCGWLRSNNFLWTEGAYMLQHVCLCKSFCYNASNIS